MHTLHFCIHGKHISYIDVFFLVIEYNFYGKCGPIFSSIVFGPQNNQGPLNAEEFPILPLVYLLKVNKQLVLA